MAVSHPFSKEQWYARCLRSGHTTVHFGLIGERIVDFPLVLIKLFH